MTKPRFAGDSYRQQQALGADVLKLAVMPHQPEDVSRPPAEHEPADA
jgi:hypothetical protein